MVRGDGHEGGLGHGALARAAHAPQQGVVGRQAAREAGQVLHEPRLLAVHADQQVQGQAVVRRRREALPRGLVAEQPGGGEVGLGGGGRGQALQGLGDARQQGFQLIGHGRVPSGRGDALQNAPGR